MAEAWDDLDDDAVHRFGTLVGEAVDPLPDVRGSVAYRRHAAAVLARRALRRAWEGRA